MRWLVLYNSFDDRIYLVHGVDVRRRFECEEHNVSDGGHFECRIRTGDKSKGLGFQISLYGSW